MCSLYSEKVSPRSGLYETFLRINQFHVTCPSGKRSIEAYNKRQGSTPASMNMKCIRNECLVSSCGRVPVGLLRYNATSWVEQVPPIQSPMSLPLGHRPSCTINTVTRLTLLLSLSLRTSKTRYNFTTLRLIARSGL